MLDLFFSPSNGPEPHAVLELLLPAIPCLEGRPEVAKRGFPHPASLSIAPLATSQDLGCS